MTKILYFAWLREKIGTAEDDVSLPDEVATVGALIDWLRARGPNYQAAFAQAKSVRCGGSGFCRNRGADRRRQGNRVFSAGDGGMTACRVLVGEADFDAGAELARLNAPGTGGIGSFIGTVRDDGVNITALSLEHYPGMTERALQKIIDEAAARWPLLACTVIHRVGRLLPGDNIVFVGAASPHREAALQATAFLIDWLKTAAPFWKREEFADGSAAWVAAREDDEAAAAAWRK